MELEVIESSIQSCVAYIRNVILNGEMDTTFSFIQVMTTYYQCYPILCDLLPHVLNTLIIEYTNEIRNIDVRVDLHNRTYETVAQSHTCVIYVTNETLNIDHTFYIDTDRTYCVDYVIISGLIVNHIRNLEPNKRISNNFAYTMKGHFHLIDYYMKQYQPQNKQFKSTLSQHHYPRSTFESNFDLIVKNISRITNKKQFNDESNVIIALFNCLINYSRITIPRSNLMMN